eukprot:scaffold305563_cov35-Tisochrysis_lutea.AAC.1
MHSTLGEVTIHPSTCGTCHAFDGDLRHHMKDAQVARAGSGVGVVSRGDLVLGSTSLAQSQLPPPSPAEQPTLPGAHNAYLDTHDAPPGVINTSRRVGVLAGRHICVVGARLHMGQAPRAFLPPPGSNSPPPVRSIVPSPSPFGVALVRFV